MPDILDIWDDEEDDRRLFGNYPGGPNFHQATVDTVGDHIEDIIASAACHPSVYRGKPPKTYYVIADRIIGALRQEGYSIVRRR